MKPGKVVFLGTLVLFGIIGIAAAKKKKAVNEEIVNEPQVEETVAFEVQDVPEQFDEVEMVDLIPFLFTTTDDKLPIVETIAYSSRVSWQKGRPAWISDYASYYATSRHFIARSLNKRADYFTQTVSQGNRFNVFKKDIDLKFNLVVDVSRCKLFFYYVANGEKVLLKVYDVGLGRPDKYSSSGILTPLGKYELAEKVAIYKPGVQGIFQDQQVEMIQVFGTRWIPFDRDGYGFHGAPWLLEEESADLIEDRSTIGRYDSDGCIRLAKEDMEELFAIVITKPTHVDIVMDYKEVNGDHVNP
ncbi:MAG: hypothetical protein SP1CHLAM54_09810 [Chlamydiia bacterium]|nr:hypothetical protein [Chlamydiia bacterium]MCH9615887.1 hypothetical protein [Chlamydiia bacterium]MCH9628710.1 hypothetical protein [Chlamydiia bacterium]